MFYDDNEKRNILLALYFEFSLYSNRGYVFILHYERNSYTRNSPNSCNSNNSWHFPLLSATLVSKLVIIRYKLGRCSWFVTTCQGGQDGDQYTYIFLKSSVQANTQLLIYSKGMRERTSNKSNTSSQTGLREWAYYSDFKHLKYRYSVNS